MTTKKKTKRAASKATRTRTVGTKFKPDLDAWADNLKLAAYGPLGLTSANHIVFSLEMWQRTLALHAGASEAVRDAYTAIVDRHRAELAAAVEAAIVTRDARFFREMAAEMDRLRAPECYDKLRLAVMWAYFRFITTGDGSEPTKAELRAAAEQVSGLPFYDKQWTRLCHDLGFDALVQKAGRPKNSDTRAP